MTDKEDMIMLVEGFEDAFIGIGTQFNRHFAIYDRQKCIEILMVHDGMEEDDAEEYFEFNVAGAWVGHGTPVFVRRMEIGEAGDVIDELQE
jgi:hypothetical protein